MNYSKLDHPDLLSYIFHPRRELYDNTPVGMDSHKIRVGEGISIHCRFYLCNQAAPHILFFHGNGEIASDYDDIGPVYNRFGLNFLAVDYRGYGGSGGSPTVTSMMNDAHTLFQEVRRWMQVRERTGGLVIMGRSLGSASALEIAYHYPSHQGI